MGERCGCHHHSTPAVLDVRELSPRERHPLIFATFDALEPGRSFVLVNDHDPKPLFYQFEAERTGTFEWLSLEPGPETWRVQIGRRAAAGGTAVSATSKVADVVTRWPQTVAVMERFGLNHCCGGHLTLAEAAAGAGVPVATVLAALDEALAVGT